MAHLNVLLVDICAMLKQQSNHRCMARFRSGQQQWLHVNTFQDELARVSLMLSDAHMVDVILTGWQHMQCCSEGTTNRKHSHSCTTAEVCLDCATEDAISTCPGLVAAALSVMGPLMSSKLCCSSNLTVAMLPCRILNKIGVLPCTDIAQE